MSAEVAIADPAFREAVAAIDSGDIPRLRALLAANPGLVTARAEEDGVYAGAYFAHPALLWFVAENPIRNRTLPDNICAVVETIVDGGASVEDITYTLGLVSSGCVARETGKQTALIETLVRLGGDPSDALGASVQERERDATETLLRLGAKPGLAAAAGLGDMKALHTALDEAAVINAQGDNDARTKLAAEVRRALYNAAVRGQVGSCDVLLDTSVIGVNDLIGIGTTALHQAAWYGHEELVHRLLQRGADPEIRDQLYNGTPSGWAAHAGRTELAEFLANVGPLVAAVKALHTGDTATLTQVLTDNLSLVNARLAERTLLHILADYPGNRPHSSESARILVAAGVPVDVRFRASQPSTPLHWAASNPGGSELCAALLDLGADIDALLADGSTPLTNAIRYGIRDTTELLVRRGARVSLVLAAALGDIERVRGFFRNDDAVTDNAGDPPLAGGDTTDILTTALVFAAMNGHDAIAALLIDRGAPIDGIDAFLPPNATALQWAAYRNHPSTIKLLLSRHADTQIADSRYGGNALAWAEHAGSDEAAEILRAASQTITPVD